MSQIGLKVMVFFLYFLLGYSLGLWRANTEAKIPDGCYFNNIQVELETYNSLMSLKELNDSLLNKNMSQEEIEVLINNLKEKHKLDIK